MTAGQARGTLSPPARRALLAAGIGNAAEWYDFALYGALGTVIVPLFFPHQDQVLLAAFALYGAAFLARPFGAVLFGRRGDSQGRQRVLVLLVGLMTGATTMVGLLPTYATIGLAAPLALVALRVGQGLAAGGELGVSAVFLVEHAPHGRRGLFGAVQTATLALGLALGLLVAGALAGLAGGSVADGWWRLAFLAALPLGLVGVYIRVRVPETPRYLDLRRTGAPAGGTVRAVWTRHRAGLRAGFALVAAGSVAFNMFFVFMPNHLSSTTSLTLAAALAAAVLGLVAAATAAVVLGRLSDRVGRRPVVLGSSAALVVAVLPMNLAAHSGSLGALALAEVAIGTAIGGILSVSMLAEMFPAELRATALGMTAGLATALVGGTAPLVGQVLYLTTGSEAAPALYVLAFGCLALAVVSSWPETAFADLE